MVPAAILLAFIDGGEERVMLTKDGDLSGLHDGCAQVTAAAPRAGMDLLEGLINVAEVQV